MTSTVAICQMDVAESALSENVATVCARLRGLSAAVDLAVFPEYALTGVPGTSGEPPLACHQSGPELERVSTVASEVEVDVVVGFTEHVPAADAWYNTVGYLTQDGDMTVYRKQHLWGQEANYLQSGTERVTVSTPIGTAGLLTCYDLNFVAESAALTDPAVTALIVPGAWPAPYSENWRLLLRARALDGVRWVIGAGRTGQGVTAAGESVQYSGRSAVVRPDGQIHKGLAREVGTLVSDLPEEVLTQQRDVVGVFE